ncbi:MAG: type II toxin-antitoxin system RelB/DinJ family antitoxin [Spirochaetales bacterium]|nr:type II toxin-antitoxin system RelB/DinJ family antitoxin [Spirochaetales bacterium]MBQ3830670.1 type II toxin-antitoxin system RelB/DinJ family antitoxin [Spirochaetales bacterium]MBQ4501509.1 type II toxin-antitoxin system RelB/DinJ family antitoxin [Spirochaetales bacterium]MBQ7283078.1 type II toxin-antitoxin system RelB/DinJ family antitoxin [Spirochaetales bacterium]MBQ7729708.1 type II toxin-antitoxin system RelB/DinJ family antitoxin [Spirochaetales bacterium]
MPSVNMCIRIDSNLKKQAEDVLSQLGMTMSGTINMFLTQIVREKAVPLNLSLSPQDRTALDDILAAREERRNGFKGYDADYVLKEMDEIISSEKKKTE